MTMRSFGREFTGYSHEQIKRWINEAFEVTRREGLKNTRVDTGPWGRLYWYGSTGNEDEFEIDGWDLK